VLRNSTQALPHWVGLVAVRTRDSGNSRLAERTVSVVACSGPEGIPLPYNRFAHRASRNKSGAVRRRFPRRLARELATQPAQESQQQEYHEEPLRRSFLKFGKAGSGQSGALDLPIAFYFSSPTVFSSVRKRGSACSERNVGSIPRYPTYMSVPTARSSQSSARRGSPSPA
jgi:hypothetical protein